MGFCRLRTLTWLGLFASWGAYAAETPELVRRHAPVLVSRWDQVLNPKTDRVLGVGYSVSEAAGGLTRIRYTTFFSDEDSLGTQKKTERQMANYGRRLDVEWTYEVIVDPASGRARRRTYQCDLILGIGHRTCTFRGNYYSHTERPILYVNARHNIFGDRPRIPYGSAYGRIISKYPRFEIPFPKSRDMIPLEYPEFLRTSDLELARENKLSRPSTEYIYLRVRGELRGKVLLTLESPDGIIYSSGTKDDDALASLGGDLWGRESVVGIAVPAPVRESLKIGLAPFRLGQKGTKAATDPRGRLMLEDVGLYLVERETNGRYTTVDLSARILCTGNELSTCRVN